MPGKSRANEPTGLYEDNREDMEALLRAMMADLGPARRNKITTSDFKENRAAYIPDAEVQSTRLVNLQGTTESGLARKAASVLEGWNNLHHLVKDDGTAEPFLGEVNEGLGQTHRGKLQADPTVKEYTGEEDYHRGGRGGRGGHSGRGGSSGRGGRGGGFVGQGSGHQTFKSRGPPVTRIRAVRGGSVNHEPPSSQANITTKESPDLQAAREFQASLGGSSKQSKKSTKALKTSMEDKSKPVATFSKDRIAISLGGTSVPRRESAPVKLASPEAFMASVRANILKIPEEPARHDSTPSAEVRPPRVILPVVAPSTKLKISLPPGAKQNSSGGVPARETRVSEVVENASPTDLMSFDLGQEAKTQPVLEFSTSQAPRQPIVPTASPLEHVQALEASGLLSAEQIAILKASIFSATQAKTTKQPTRSKKYTPDELRNLRPRAEPALPPTVTVTSPRTRDTTQQDAEAVTSQRYRETIQQDAEAANPFGPPAVPLQPAIPKERVLSFAQRLENQRRAFIGEHIYRTRFQRNTDTLIEGIEKLSISDHSNTESVTEIIDTPASKSTNTLANAFGTSKTKNSGPALPPHLRSIAPALDHGAAVRAQYGIPAAPAPVPKTQTEHSITTKANENLQQYPRHDRDPSEPVATARTHRPTRSGPALPAHLQGQTVGDAGAAARAQYGITAVPAPVSDTHTEHSLTMKANENQRHFLQRDQAPSEPVATAPPRRPTRSGPALPAHLRGQTVADAGAAVRAQYGKVLTSVSNSSTPSSNTNSSPTKKAVRGSQNDPPGSAGSTQGARRGRKAVDDPMQIAGARGF